MERLSGDVMVILLMGVSGSGKTTIGLLLARELGWPFADADDFHSPANRAKMDAGQPLDDEDRAPWLADLRRFIDARAAQGENAVLACSALKERYRRVLLSGGADVRIVFLTGDAELIRARLESRTNHYMRANLLESQIAALEPPAGVATVDVSATPMQIVAAVRRELQV